MADLVPVSLGKHSRQRRISLSSLPAFQLARATVRDPKTGVLTVASYRVSKRLAEVVVAGLGVVVAGVAAPDLSPAYLQGFLVYTPGSLAWLVLPASTFPT